MTSASFHEPDPTVSPTAAGEKVYDESIRSQFAGLDKDELIKLLMDRRPEGINLVFAGKAEMRRIVRRVRPRAQREITNLCVGTSEDQARNKILEGENLQAMVSLHKYHGSVDLILTDPPYNTGRDFRYNDRWEENPNDPDPGTLVSAEDPARYTKWMKFMLPRIQMMRAMLKPSGVLAICIDHRELFRLGILLDEVFGQENRLGVINWQKTTPKNDTKHLVTSTEYVLIYARDEARARSGLLERKESTDRRFTNPDNDPRGVWQWGDLTARENRPLTSYAIQSPFTGELHRPQRRHWSPTREQMKEWLEAWGTPYDDMKVDADPLDEESIAPTAPRTGKGAHASTKKRRAPALVLQGWSPTNSAAQNAKVIAAARKRAAKILDRGNWPPLYWGQDGMAGPAKKHWLAAVKAGAVPTTFWVDAEDHPLNLESVSWDHRESGRSRDGIEELDAIVGPGHGFETVKPLKLFRKIIQIWCPRDGIVLDPFAGSGTTAHALLELNAESSATRSFVLIEQGRVERADQYARTLTASRVARAITGAWHDGAHSALGGGFTFASLTEQVDAQVVLAMEREEMIDLLVSSHWDKDTRNRPTIVKMVYDGYHHLIARDGEGHGYFLLWHGAQDHTTLDSEAHDAIVDEARRAGLKAPHNVYARYEDYQSEDVRFFKIPDRILIHLGVDEMRDAYNGAATTA